MCSPGSASGSQASRLAHVIFSEIVSRCDYGIDLHTAATHRVNLPQIRCAYDKRARTRELALLRAVGASRGQILGSVLLEASIVGN